VNDVRDRLQAALGASYMIERELGGGGMSRVFVATESALGRQVVVKVVAAGDAEGMSTERFAREVQLAARLQQANVLPLLSAGDADGLPYYTMPFVRGESLRDRLRRGAVPLAEAVGILRDVARALAYAHAEGVVHRDIKPENILLSGGTAVVTDFGIAKALSAARTHGATTSATLTQLGTSVGTPAYMSPEQAAGDQVDHRTDLYAWGVVAYELLTGAHPFAAHVSPRAMLTAHIADAPPPLSTAGVPPSLAALVMRCLAKDPAGRPPSATELLGLLETVATSHAGDTAWRARRHALGWAALVVVAAGVAAFLILGRRSGAPPPATAGPSIAVLAFESVGGDTANVYFAEGMADELTTALAKLPGLRVAATSSAFTYRGRNPDPREVGRALEVATVLQGRVRRDGRRLRVSAQLTNTADGSLLWGETYEREVQDVFAVQDDLTRGIVAALRVALAGDTSHAALAANRGTEDVEAYDLYLRGLFFLGQRGRGIARSIPYFRDAIDRDPRFARAWAQLGMAHCLQPLFESVPIDAAIRESRSAADRAITLDPASAEARTASGLSYLLSRDWPRARAELERAIALDPTYTTSYRFMASLVSLEGRAEDVAEQGRRGVETDPLSATAHANYAMSLLNARRWEDGVREATRAVELDSTNALETSSLGLALFLAGERDRARSQAHRAVRSSLSAGWVGYVLARSGDSEEADRLAQAALRDGSAFAHITAAWVRLAEGDTTRALAELESAVAANELVAFAWWGMSVYYPLRRSQRFAALLRRAGVDPSPFTVASPH
jgi:serine/threonine-protein kinase